MAVRKVDHQTTKFSGYTVSPSVKLSIANRFCPTLISESIRTSQYSGSDLPIGSKYVSDVEKCLTDDLTFVGGSEEEEEEEVSIEMLGRVSDEVVVSSVERDRLTNSTDADVVVVRPVGPVIPLSLLDDAEIPDGSGMCRLDTGGVSPVDARE